MASNVYKILAKVLVERLDKIIPSTISLNQNAFIKGRKIINPVLVDNEAMLDYRSNKKMGWLLKLDLEKTCDSVDWDFLLEISKEVDFVKKMEMGKRLSS